MLFVHEKKDNPGRWEVAWMWLPHFLAADRELHRHIDKTMTEEFKGTMLEEDMGMDQVVERMSHRVQELILEKYPISGLRPLLESYVHLQPDEGQSPG